jgi:hypothetical protein
VPTLPLSSAPHTALLATKALLICCGVVGSTRRKAALCWRGKSEPLPLAAPCLPLPAGAGSPFTDARACAVEGSSDKLEPPSELLPPGPLLRSAAAAPSSGCLRVVPSCGWLAW